MIYKKDKKAIIYIYIYTHTYMCKYVADHVLKIISTFKAFNCFDTN